MFKKILFKSLTQQEQDLLIQAHDASKMAYAPYSATMVGSAVLTDDNQIIKGANLEYAPFDSVCAERTALLSANTDGKTNIKLIGLYTKKMHSRHVEPAVCCAKCRVMIMQFEKRVGHKIQIVSACPNLKNAYKFNLQDIMP